MLLAPGSWAARLRLAAVLRHVPGRWDEAAEQAALAARFAPEEPDPHVLVGDLALLRAEHAEAARAYREALRLDPRHAQARVNLGLTLLRWERSRTHHDPAWPIDPREHRPGQEGPGGVVAPDPPAGRRRDRRRRGGRPRLRPGAAGRAGRPGRAGPLAGLTVRQARRVRAWAYVPAMLGRDPWFGAAVAGGIVAVAAFAGWLALGSAPAGIAVVPGLRSGGLPWVGLLWAGLAVSRCSAGRCWPPSAPWRKPGAATPCGP